MIFSYFAIDIMDISMVLNVCNTTQNYFTKKFDYIIAIALIHA
jgi:hypothetical protein